MGCINSKDDALEKKTIKMINNPNNNNNNNNKKKRAGDLKELIKNSTTKFKQLIKFEKSNIDNYDIIEISYNGENCDRFYCINDEVTGDEPIFLNFKKNDAYKDYQQFDISDVEIESEINMFTFNAMDKILNDLNSCKTNYNISIKKLNSHNNRHEIFSIFNYLVNVEKFKKSNLSQYIQTIGKDLNDENTFLGLFLFIPGVIDSSYIVEYHDNGKSTTNYKKIFKIKYQKSIQIDFQ